MSNTKFKFSCIFYVNDLKGHLSIPLTYRILLNATRKAWRVFYSVFDLTNLTHDNKLHDIYPMWHTCENRKASQSVICIFKLVCDTLKKK